MFNLFIKKLNKFCLRFLALGDSYTIGQSVSVEERWPNQLVTISRNWLAQPWLVASDGLHPSGQMYALWVQEIVKYSVKSLPLHSDRNPRRKININTTKLIRTL